MICRKSDSESARIAADFLRHGKIVILPTDTVYGFSGIVDGRHYSYHTDEKIRQIKDRAASSAESEQKSFIQLISKPDDIKKYTRVLIPDELFAKWPCAITIVVYTFAADGNFEKTAFRCPGDEWLRNVISFCGAPIYSTSVNKSGKPFLNTVSEIKREFGRAVDLFVEDGDKKNGVPSTIVEIEKDGSLNILRQGAVTI